MPAKKRNALTYDATGNIKNLFSDVHKSKPKKYTAGVIEEYIREREISIGDEKSKQWLKEHEI